MKTVKAKTITKFLLVSIFLLLAWMLILIACGGGAGSTATPVYNLGDTGPGGGKIFYVNPSGFTLYRTATDATGITAHYLEAAPVVKRLV